MINTCGKRGTAKKSFVVNVVDTKAPTIYAYKQNNEAGTKYSGNGSFSKTGRRHKQNRGNDCYSHGPQEAEQCLIRCKSIMYLAGRCIYHKLILSGILIKP
jgi:hypothetical protein